MTKQLLLVHLGPVQEFIAQGRRSRDLWFGSHLLSELSRAVARCLVAESAEIVFPDVGANDLEPQDSPLDATGCPVVPLPNHVLVSIPAAADGALLAKLAQAAAAARLRGLADQVWSSNVATIDASKELWNEQIDTLLEFHAAWAKWENPKDYARVRRDLEFAVSSRRNLRTFAPWKHDRLGAPKSSLDGARVSVLRTASVAGTSPAWRRLRLGRGEQLDAIGLVKRAGGDPDQFVPLANVAAAGWLRLAAAKCPELLDAVAYACVDADLGRVANPALPWACWPRRDHGFDAECLYEGRWQAVLEENGATPQQAGAWGQQFIAPLHRQLRSPTPYVACLVADGDRVGAALDAITDPGEHRAFSACLAQFAGRCHRVIADHSGLPVYSGGDDVLAFVGVEQAVALADELRARFSVALSGRLPAGVVEPTLSVGLGVGHLLDGMAHLLHLGRSALQLAKGEGKVAADLTRNALGVVVDKRSGGTTSWRMRWDAEAGSPASRLQQVAAMLIERRLPRGKIYEVAAALRRFPQAGEVDPNGEWARALVGEVRRILARAHADQSLNPVDAGLDLVGASFHQARERIAEWVERCKVAFLLVPETAKEAI